MTGQDFDLNFFSDWRKRFIFEKTFINQNGEEKNIFGESNFDPADSKLLSRNDTEVTFGFDISSVETFPEGSNPAPMIKIMQSPNHNSGELSLSFKSSNPGLPKTYNRHLISPSATNGKADIESAIAAIKAKSQDFNVRFDSQSNQIFASNAKHYVPSVYPDCVNQVDDSPYRQAAAILFGFGKEVNRNLETINSGSLVGMNRGFGVVLGEGINDSADNDLILLPRSARQTYAHPKGVKYGMMNYDHIRPKVIFSRNSYGNFSDLVQGRKSAVFANISGDTLDKNSEISPDGRTVSVEVDFFDANRALLKFGSEKIKFLFSQNLDRYQRSRVPFFDLPNPNEHESAKGGRVRGETDKAPAGAQASISIFGADGSDIFDDFN
tara:strand:- start:72 stop:1214 length:1143 start_codon:yes stop_codon:yes gene_type:complete